MTPRILGSAVSSVCPRRSRLTLGLLACLACGDDPVVPTNDGLNILEGAVVEDTVLAIPQQKIVIEVEGAGAGIPVAFDVVPASGRATVVGDTARTNFDFSYTVNTDTLGRASARVRFGITADTQFLKISVPTLNLVDSVQLNIKPGNFESFSLVPLYATIVQGDSVTFEINSFDLYNNQRTGDTLVLGHATFLDTVTTVVGNVVHGVHVGISPLDVFVNSRHRGYTVVYVMPRVHFGGINEDGVVTVRADGDSLAVLVPLSFSEVGVTNRMSWAADSAVVFDHDGILYWAQAGRITRQLTEETDVAAHPSITADGQWIYYSLQAGGVWEIHRIKADGTGDSVLVSGTESFSWPSISPDGSTLVYLAGFELRRRDMATGTTTTINARAMSPSWAPDGTRLAFFCDGSQICLVDANGNDLGQLVTFLTRAPGLYWSRDGEWLLSKVVGYYPELINVDSGGWLRATVFPPLGDSSLQQSSLSLMP